MRTPDETGSTVLQTVILMGALLMLLMAVVQFGLYYHARNVADSAAQQGAAEGRRFDGTAQEARVQTNQALDTLGPKMLTNRNVTVNRTANEVSVSVTGTSVSLVPFLKLPITESATGPVERYVPPTEHQ